MVAPTCNLVIMTNTEDTLNITEETTIDLNGYTLTTKFVNVTADLTVNDGEIVSDVPAN